MSPFSLSLSPSFILIFCYSHPFHLSLSHDREFFWDIVKNYLVMTSASTISSWNRALFDVFANVRFTRWPFTQILTRYFTLTVKSYIWVFTDGIYLTKRIKSYFSESSITDELIFPSLYYNDDVHCYRVMMRVWRGCNKSITYRIVIYASRYCIPNLAQSFILRSLTWDKLE